MTLKETTNHITSITNVIETAASRCTNVDELEAIACTVGIALSIMKGDKEGTEKIMELRKQCLEQISNRESNNDT